MASFVDPASGDPTTDTSVHGYGWVAFSSGDLNANLKKIQEWLTITTINGFIRYGWADLVALWCEFGLIGDTVANSLVLSDVIEPDAVARGLLTILDPMPTEPLTRAQFARHVRYKARHLSAEDTARITLRSADLISRPHIYLPDWQKITYAEASSMGGGMLLSWLYFYDARALSGNSDTSFQLLQVRSFAEMNHLLPANTIPPRPPLAIPAEVPGPGPDDPPANQAAIVAAIAAAEHDRRLPQPDSCDAATVKFAVLDLLAFNPYQVDFCLRSEAAAGAPRSAACLVEVSSLRSSLRGTDIGLRSRIPGIVSAATPEGEPNNLFKLTHTRDDELPTSAYPSFLKDLAQIVLPSDAAKEEILLTPQGIRTLNIALGKHAAYIEHHMHSTSTESGRRPTTRDVLEWLARRMAENPAVSSSSLSYPSGGAVAAANINVAGSTGKGVNHAAYFVAAAKAENAQVLLWAGGMLGDPTTTSIAIHQALLVARNADHPSWSSTGFLHALAFGQINAAILDPKLAAVYEYSSNKYIGVYLCHMIARAMERAKLLTSDQVRYLKGFSLEELAQVVRSNDWSRLDVVNHIDYAIQRKLAEMTWLEAPSAMPYELTLTDTSMVTRAICLVKALFEALGLQRDGECSIAKLMSDLNTEVIANTATPTPVLVKMIEANVAIYQLAFTLAGRDYAACRGSVNVHMPLPSTNFKREDIEPHLEARERKVEQLLKVMLEMGARKLIGIAADSFSAGQGGVEAAVAAIRNQYYTSSKSGKNPGGDAAAAEAKRQRDAAEAEEAAKKSKLDIEQAAKAEALKKENEAKSQAKRLADAAAFDAAERATIEGAPPDQWIAFGPRKWDMHAMTQKYGTDFCYPALVAASCGANKEASLRYARKCCPQTEAVHPDGCPAHTPPPGFKISDFRLDKPKAPTGKGKGGKGGRGGKGKGKPSRRKGGGKGKGKGQRQ